MEMTRQTTPASPSPELPPTLGPVVCRWIEQNLVHGEGDFLGQPFLLERWQREIIYRLYEYDPKTGRRLVRRALIILPKGCGKTELTAAIGLAELCGPVTVGPDGNPARRTAPNIPVAAASYEQANKLYGAAKLIAERGPLSQFLEIYDTQMQLRGDVGTMFRVAAEAGTNDGGLPTAFLADEIHEWVGRRARVHLVIGNSLAKREGGLEINLSTPDDADPDSLLGRLAGYGDRILSGEVSDPSFLYVRYSAPLETPLDDPVALRTALRACHPASWLDLERVAARWEVDRIPEHEFRRYHLAQFVRPASAWLREGAWAACSDPSRTLETIPDGTEIVLGFDGSYNDDSTALVACTLEERPHLFVVGAWEKSASYLGADWTVPRDEVDAAVHHAMQRFKVRELAADPPGWHKEIESWAERYGDTVTTEFRTNLRKFMSRACAKLHSAVVNGQMTHDGDPRLARHIANAVVKETPEGAYITKEHRHSSRKIDLAIAAVIAYDRATERQVFESVYETRGLLILSAQ